MHLTKVALLALLGLPVISATPLGPRDELAGLENLNKQALITLGSLNSTPVGSGNRTACKCNLFNAHIRRDWEDPNKSPAFDGSETSFGGNGFFVPHDGRVTAGGNFWIPSGQGGGCMASGPFVDYQINLGPVMPIQYGMSPAPTPLGYNPHCLSCNLSAYTAIHWLTLGNILNVTLGAASCSIIHFQNELQGRFNDGFLGLHTAGHGVMGGVSGDSFSSPVDPVFWLHHAMVDRVYWLGQALHSFQAHTVAGIIKIFNNPPSRNTSVDDIIDLGVNTAPIAIGNVLNTLGGDPMCYIYK